MLVWIQNPFDNLPAEGYRKQRYWLMAEAFLRAGHRVVYWTSDFSHARKRKREEGGARRGEGIEVRLIPTLPYSKNISLDRIRSHRAYACDWKRLALDSGNRTIEQSEQSEQSNSPSLIVSSCPTLSAAAAVLEIGHALGAKVVIDVQDAWPETFERLAPKGLRGLARLALTPLRLKARRIYREADLVTGVCDAYRELTGRSDYWRAYLGIDCQRPRVSTAEAAAERSLEWCEDAAGTVKSYENATNRMSAVRLVYAGGLGKTYDLKTLVAAVEANREMTLDVAGFGDFSCACPRVKFHGMLSAENLRKLYATCDIGVIPMNDDSGVGLPNKIFDYAAAGLGIVSSLGGESAAILKKYKCGTTYNPGDVASLTAAIRQAKTLASDASRTMCAVEFDARKIYDAYVAHVTAFCQ